MRSDDQALTKNIKDAIQEAVAESVEDIIKRERKYRKSQNVVLWLIGLLPLLLAVMIFTPLGDWLGIRGQWWHTISQEDLESLPIIGNPQAVSDAITTAITVLGPIIIGIVIWLIVTVGVGRLRRYDEIIDNIRIEIRDADRRTSDKMAGMPDQIGKAVLGEVSEAARAQMAKAAEVQKAEIGEFIAGIRRELTELTKEIFDTKTAIEDRFGHIAETAGYARSDSKFGPLSSVGAVLKKVRKLFAGGSRAEAVLLVRELLHKFRTEEGEARPAGTLQGDWFNLSAQLGSNDEKRLALSVCLAGLEQQNNAPVFLENGNADWQNHTILPDDDLLAHAIQYAMAVNDTRIEKLLALNGFDSKNPVGHARWGWRQFDFTISALASLGRYDDAIKLGKSFMADEARPIDADTSKVVQTLARIMNTRGDRLGATELLQTWLDDHPDAPAAQIISTLLDWSDGSLETERLIALANRGIRDLAEEQASTVVASMFHRRALARDKRATDMAMGGKHEGIDICTEINLALQDYAQAEATGLIPGFASNAESRVMVLRQIAQEQECDIADDADRDAPESGESEGPLERIKSVLQSLVAIIMADAIPDQEKVAALVEKLSGEDPEIRNVIMNHLDQLAEDSDTPEEMRLMMARLMPPLKDHFN